MRRIVNSICLLLVSISLHAATLSTVKKDLDHLINKFDPNINIGIAITDLTTNKTVYTRNANRYYVPASTLKMVTGAAALLYLGADYRFKTKLYTNSSQIKNAKLQGNLFLKFDGAPDLSDADLIQLFSQLKHFGISSISGNVVLVGDNVTNEGYGPGWMVDDIRHSYGAPITPYLVNQNRLDVFVSPATKLNAKAHIAFVDPAKSIQLKNELITSQSNKQCQITLRMDKQNHLNASGCIGIGASTHERDVSVINTLNYAVSQVDYALNKANIKYVGKIKPGELPKNLKKLVEISSDSVGDLLKQTLKPSDNLFADSVFLKIGQKYYKTKGSWKNASKAVKKLLTTYVDKAFKGATIFDGSGLSRYNLITPSQLTKLLTVLYQQFPLSYEFITALPVGGKDGTLSNRFTKGMQRAMVRAKTGSMLGVISLAGYVPTKNNHLLAFSILINNISGQSSCQLGKYRVLQDQICQYLLKTKLWRKILSQAQPRLKPFPFQMKQSVAQKQRQYQNKLRNLDWALRDTFKSLATTVIRYPNKVVIRLTSEQVNSDFFVKRLQKLNKIIKNRKVWALFDGFPEKNLVSISKVLPKNKYILGLDGSTKNTQVYDILLILS